ncbi:MAG: type II secretion system F family protein [Clostridia bacterium]|nr:type II secretion system F family protein [Clostridia bacterium]
MQKYSYQALTPDGKTVRGTMIANNDEELKQLVAKSGNTCVKFTKLSGDSGGGKPLPLKAVGNFCSQLAAILKAGLPLASALDMLYGKLDKGPLKESLGKIYEMVQKGNSLSDALNAQGRAYPPLMLNMVKAGEMSGDLDNSLNKLADHFEKEQKTRNSVKAALRYPKVLAFVTLGVVILMVAVVLPKLTSTMEKESLPTLTKILMGLSDFIVDNFIFIAVGVIFLIIIVPMIKNIEKVRYKLDKFKITMPKIGKLMRMIYTARFARSLATLYDGGIQLLDAMQMCTAIVGNVYVSEKMEDAIYRVKKGESISKAMASIDVFDPMLTSMIFVGEESGVLGEVLLRVADYFDEESDAATKALTALLEPVMLIVMAGVIVLIILAILLPMFSSYNMEV